MTYFSANQKKHRVVCPPPDNPAGLWSCSCGKTFPSPQQASAHDRETWEAAPHSATFVLAEGFSDMDPTLPRPKPVALMRLLTRPVSASAGELVTDYGFVAGCSCGKVFPTDTTVAEFAEHLQQLKPAQRKV